MDGFSGAHPLISDQWKGEQLTEMKASGAWDHSNVYAGGALLATYSGTDTYFAFNDWLGTKRAELRVSDGCLETYASLPFGDKLTPAGNCPDATEQHFTGKERDTESGNDYFGARYYANTMGRFMSPDPVIITPERLQNPQQLNLYAYVANNPLRFIDPTGEVVVATGNQQADYNDLCKIAGDACARRLSIDPKTGNVTFNTGALDENTPALDLSKNEGASLVNDLVSSKNTYEFSEGPTVMTASGPRKFDFITNLPSFGDQPNQGQPRAGVSDVVALNFKNLTFESFTNLGPAPQFTQAFHELAEAYAKIDGGNGGSYPDGHSAAIQRESRLRDQRPYLKQYNYGSGGPANGQATGKVIIRQ